ncbi:MAG TPA: LCP family protein, partial [Anaerolineaceae bacterium]|nr:LCP family protein [Anaerolineaceae bacterium]
MTQKNTSQPRRRVVFDRLTILLLIVFVILAIVTGVAVFRLVKNTVAGWNITPLEGVSIQSTTTVNGTPVSLPGGALQPEGGPTAEPWDGNSRVTILLMGLDYRDWEAGEVPHTDSMILLTIDPMTSSAGMLSIPRDMWVNIPGYDYYKINQAYYFGELDQLPGGGPALAVKTVESFIGVPITYYAQIDFGAFVRVIDEIGGVKIDVPEKITIDPIGDSPKVTLEPGRYTLNGELALAYARSRKGSGDDFARAERQQQVILAVRDRILQFDQMPSLVT